MMTDKIFIEEGESGCNKEGKNKFLNKDILDILKGGCGKQNGGCK